MLKPCGSKISSKSLHLTRFSRLNVFVFCNFCEKFENSNGRHIWRDKKFLIIEIVTRQMYPVGQKFRRNRSISHGFRDISIFVFCNFCEKCENSKWPPYLARQKFFEKWDRYSAEIPCGSKISSKSLYLAWFSRYKHFCVLQFFRKIRKFKMAAIFGETKIFENWDRYFAEMGQKFRRNRSISHGFRDISIFVFCNFCEKFENSKWPPYLARQIFFENWDRYSAEIPCGSKILSKSLYLARFSRYKQFYIFSV